MNMEYTQNAHKRNRNYLWTFEFNRTQLNLDSDIFEAEQTLLEVFSVENTSIKVS